MPLPDYGHTDSELMGEPDESLNLKMYFLPVHYEKAISEKWRPVTWKVKRMILCENCQVSEWVSECGLGGCEEDSICQIRPHHLAPSARRGRDGGPLNTPVQFYTNVWRAGATRAVWFVRCDTLTCKLTSHCDKTNTLNSRQRECTHRHVHHLTMSQEPLLGETGTQDRGLAS